MSQMEGQEQGQPATDPQQQPQQQQQQQQQHQQQPPQGSNGHMAGQEVDHQAGSIGGISMNLPVGQPPFASMGQLDGFAPESQPSFNGNNGFFVPPNMMFPLNQQMMDTNGTAPEHAVNGNAAISAGEFCDADYYLFSAQFMN